MESEIAYKMDKLFEKIMALLGVIIIPLFIWGVTVEKRLDRITTNKESINEMKKDQEKNFEKIYDLLLEIKKDQYK